VAAFWRIIFGRRKQFRVQQYLSYTRSKKTKAPRLTRHSRGVWGNPPPVQMISLSLSLSPFSGPLPLFVRLPDVRGFRDDSEEPRASTQ